MVETRLDEVVEHMELYRQIAEKSRPLVGFDNPNPTIDEIVEQWQDSVDTGYSMLNDDRFFIVANEDLPKSYEDVGAYTDIKKDPEKEYIVFTDTTFWSEDNGIMTERLISVVMHELDHAIDPKPFSRGPHGHDKDLPHPSDDHPEFEDTTQYLDVPYQDTRLFRAFSDLTHAFDQNEYTTFEMYFEDCAHPDNGEYYFSSYYQNASDMKNMALHDHSAWAHLLMDNEEYSSGQPEYTQQRLLDTSWNAAYVRSGIIYDLEVSTEDFEVILAGSETDFLSKKFVEKMNGFLEELRDRFPEHYEAYRAEQRQKTEPAIKKEVTDFQNLSRHRRWK